MRRVAFGGRRGLSSTPRMKKYGMSSSSVESPGCIALTDTGHSIRTDLPRQVGGQDTGPQPVELMLAALLGCKTATAHFVARHLWPRPHHRIHTIKFEDVEAERDERGALTLPITQQPPASAALVRVRGVAIITPMSTGAISAADVSALGELVEQRCPVAATLLTAGCKLDFVWRLSPPAPDN